MGYDAALADRRFIAGEDFSVADITLFVTIDFMRYARLACPPDLTHLARWRTDVAARPSAAA